jgi:uncharacterized protein (DUF433 family)
MHWNFVLLRSHFSNILARSGPVSWLKTQIYIPQLIWLPSCKFFKMTLNFIDRITINPEVCHGKPTIRGLRYPVDMMLELLASGMTAEEILSDYSDLKKEDILACIDYGH